MRCIEWWHFKWPSVTPNSGFKSRYFSKVNIVSALTLLVGWQEGHPVCKKTGCWWWWFDWRELCTTYGSCSPVVTTTSIILCFNKHQLTQVHLEMAITRSSADADNRLDAFSGQSRSTNMVPFHMLHSFLLCNSNFVFKTRRFYDIRLQKFHDLEMGVKGHSRSLRVISFNRLCMVSY